MTFEPCNPAFRGMGHKNMKTTMTYTRVLNRAGKGVKSPADAL